VCSEWNARNTSFSGPRNELWNDTRNALWNAYCEHAYYESLAFGHSQLDDTMICNVSMPYKHREYSAYFFAKAHEVSVADIPEWMGGFSNIRIIASHASGLGQCFSTTKAF
jgi:RNA-dependent RNA polymerase